MVIKYLRPRGLSSARLFLWLVRGCCCGFRWDHGLYPFSRPAIGLCCSYWFFVVGEGDVAAVSGGTTGCIPFRGLLLGFVGRIGLWNIS